MSSQTGTANTLKIAMPKLSKRLQATLVRMGQEGRYDSKQPCDECGRPLGQHMIGGTAPYHPTGPQ